MKGKNVTFEAKQWLANYHKLNSSFSQRLVFNIGTEAGFFSEYNNMLLAALFCLNNSIKFSLHSGHANFSLATGWTDYFEPFWPEVRGNYHQKFNARPGQLNEELKKGWQIKLTKLRYGINFFTQDLWKFHRDAKLLTETFDFPELGLVNASLLQTTQQFIRHNWVYNSSAQLLIDNIKRQLVLPPSYLSMHIRQGDKFKEHSLFEVSAYMEVASSIASSNDIFVLTDDYTVVEQMRQEYPSWRVYTLCEPTQRGYFQDQFDKETKLARYQHNLKLFAEIDIAASATHFVGTYSSNIGMYMGMRIGQEKCFCLDFDAWRIW